MSKIDPNKVFLNLNTQNLGLGVLKKKILPKMSFWIRSWAHHQII